VKAFRCPDNPIIKPAVGDEIVLLARVAERPINTDADTVLTAVYDVNEDRLKIERFRRSDPNIDFSDPRLIVKGNETYLTSISHLRVARSKDGVNFEIDDLPAISAANEYETFGVEDPRISLIDGTYYVHYVAVSPFGVVTLRVSNATA